MPYFKDNIEPLEWVPLFKYLVCCMCYTELELCNIYIDEEDQKHDICKVCKLKEYKVK